MSEETTNKVVETTQIEAVEQVKGTLKWAVNGGITNPTPSWAMWMFRTEFVLNKCFAMWLASQNSLNLQELKSLVLWVTIIDFAVWGFAKQFGIKKEDLEK